MLDDGGDVLRELGTCFGLTALLQLQQSGPLKGLVQAIGLFTYFCVGLPALIFYSWFNIQWLNIYELFLVDELNVFSIIISNSCLDMKFDRFSRLIFIVAKNACSSKQRLEHVALNMLYGTNQLETRN